MEDKMRIHYAPIVSAGAVLLDSYRRGWFRDVNRDNLDIQDLDNCVLGQLGGYNYMSDELFGDVEYDDRRQMQEDYGFDVAEDDYNGEDFERRFDMLNDLWRREITDRLNADEN